MTIQLMQGDCLELMKQIPAGSVDMILTDPPYGTTACKWDNVIPFEPMWEQVWRVLKPNGACLLFGSEPFSSALRMSQIKRFKYDWVWKKSKGSNFVHAPNMPLKTIEIVSVFSGGIVGHKSQTKNRMNYNPQGITKSSVFVKQNENTSELKFHRKSQSNHKAGYACKNANYPTVMLEFKSENGHHPTQKPVQLLEYLIKTYTLEGETILDFTLGSGSTGVACVNTGRKFIGIEQDDKYFAIAQKRIVDAQVPKELWS